MVFPETGVSRQALRGRERQYHLGAGAASASIGEPQAAAESPDRGLRQQQADPGTLFALGRKKTLSRSVPRGCAGDPRPAVLDEDSQALEAPAAVHLHLPLRRRVCGVVEEVDDRLAQTAVRGYLGRRLYPAPAAYHFGAGPQALPAVENAAEKRRHRLALPWVRLGDVTVHHEIRQRPPAGFDLVADEMKITRRSAAAAAKRVLHQNRHRRKR